MYTVIGPKYSNQSFEGNVIKGKGMRRFVSETLNNAAEIYGRKSGELPDIEISRLDRSPFIDIIIGDDIYLTKGSISIPVQTFENMLNDYNGKKLGSIFLNLAKRAQVITKIDKIEVEKKLLERELNIAESYAQKMHEKGYMVHENRFNREATSTRNYINALKQDLDKAKNTLCKKNSVLKSDENIAKWLL